MPKKKKVDWEQIIESIENTDVMEISDETIRLTPEGEEVLLGLHKAKEAVEKIDKIVKERIRYVVGLSAIKSYEGEKMKVGHSTRETKKITDEVDEKFVINKKTPNTSAINAYVKVMGELPKGVETSQFTVITYKPLKIAEEE